MIFVLAGERPGVPKQFVGTFTRNADGTWTFVDDVSHSGWTATRWIGDDGSILFRVVDDPKTRVHSRTEFIGRFVSQNVGWLENRRAGRR